jgi:DNA-binding transcriptional LysR family regulator
VLCVLAWTGERSRFDWNRARAFLVTAEEGSFSAAGRALGIAQPTVGRQVAALEEELGVALFERVGNALDLTAAGLDLLEHVRAMGEAATRVSLDGDRAVARDRGHGLHHRERADRGVHPAADRRPPPAEHPGIEIEIVASNAARDLRRREADIAIRNFTPTQPELVARKIATASPTALRQRRSISSASATRAAPRTCRTQTSSASTAPSG